MTRTALPTVAVATALVLALSACGGDPEPTATSAAPAPAVSASPEASPSASPSGAGEQQLYVALGDSLAAGYQPGGAELRETAYPALAANRLGSDGAEHRGRVRLGGTTEQRGAHGQDPCDRRPP